MAKCICPQSQFKDGLGCLCGVLHSDPDPAVRADVIHSVVGGEGEDMFSPGEWVADFEESPTLTQGGVFQ